MSKLRFQNSFLATASIVIILDQFSKYWIENLRPSLDVSWLTIHYSTNTGAGFGILQGNAFALGIVSLLVAVGIVYYYKQIEKKTVHQALFALLLGGTIGNMIDRFVRGYVVDFIDFGFWPSFNIADSAITIAVIGIVFLLGKEELEERERKHKKK